MHTKKEVIRRNLTQVEKDDLAEKILRAQDKIDDHDSELKDAREMHKLAVKPLKSQIKFDRGLRRAGYIDEEKEVVLRFDRTKGITTFVDPDTGEELGSRRMQSEEYSMIDFEVTVKDGTNG